MTVSLFVMKGPYDEQLKWSMKGAYEVKLLNKDSDSMHHSALYTVSDQNTHKPFGKRNVYPAWYSNMFISHNALTAPTKGFLKDDNICFQVCNTP